MQGLVQRLQLDLEPRVGPYPFAVSGKQEWDGKHGKGYEAQQAGDGQQSNSLYPKLSSPITPSQA
jgi:hypothetical protein